MVGTRWIVAVSLALAALASGCGGDAARERHAVRVLAPAAPPTVPAAPAAAPANAASPVRVAAGSADAAKSDLRQAVSIIESYRGSSQTDAAASDLNPVAASLPGTVTVTRSDAYGYVVSAGTNYGATFTIERADATTVKRCAPIHPVDCRTGEW